VVSDDERTFKHNRWYGQTFMEEEGERGKEKEERKVSKTK